MTDLNQKNGEPSAAEVLALGNRLRALKLSPGFQDLRLICERIAQDAQSAPRNFVSKGGFDPIEIVKLEMQAYTAVNAMNEIFSIIDAAIGNATLPGLNNTQDPQQAPEKTISNRIAGSY